MNTHEIAKYWLDNPDKEIEVSLDIPTGVIDKHGDEIIAKVFGSGLVDYFSPNHDSATLHFEVAHSGGEGVDVVEVVKLAQKQQAIETKQTKQANKKRVRKRITGRFDTREELVNFICSKYHKTTLHQAEIARLTSISETSVAKILSGIEGDNWLKANKD
jgi:hypothetical protein